MDTVVTFIAAISSSPSAIKFSGNHEGGSVLLEFPETECERVQELLAMRQKSLVITAQFMSDVKKRADGAKVKTERDFAPPMPKEE